jgi:hypothetical protein
VSSVGRFITNRGAACQQPLLFPKFIRVTHGFPNHVPGEQRYPYHRLPSHRRTGLVSPSKAATFASRLPTRPDRESSVRDTCKPERRALCSHRLYPFAAAMTRCGYSVPTVRLGKLHPIDSCTVRAPKEKPQITYVGHGPWHGQLSHIPTKGFFIRENEDITELHMPP